MSSSFKHKKKLTRRSTIRSRSKGLFFPGRTMSSSFKHKKGLTRRSTIRSRPNGLSETGEKDKKYCSLHFTRGLRLHRYSRVALRGFFSGRTTSSSFKHKKGLTRRSTIRSRPKGLLVPEERCPRRSSTRRG